MVERDFAFHGNSAGNRLFCFHDHGQIIVRAALPRDNPDGTGTREPGAKAGSA
jgi:hypothetical protein